MILLYHIKSVNWSAHLLYTVVQYFQHRKAMFYKSPPTEIFIQPFHTHLRGLSKRKNDIFCEFFPTWGGGVARIPKLL